MPMPPLRNPYLNRSMIRSVDEFHGRRRELQRVLSRIGAPTPQSVSLVGERRMGKSSLLWHLSQPEIHGDSFASPSACLFALLDFQGHQDLDQAACCALLAQRLAEAAGNRLALPPDTQGGLEQLRATAEAASEAGLRLVCLFDEFETVTRNASIGPEFYGLLRSLANSHDVAFVTASRRPLQDLCHSQEISESPFFNIFSEVRLGPMADDEVHELIVGPSASVGAPLVGLEASIRDLGGRLPFFLQIACSTAMECLAEGGEVDAKRLEQGFLEEAKSHFHYLWEAFDDSERVAVLAAAAGEAVDVGVGQRLEEQGYLLRAGDDVVPFSVALRSFVLDPALTATEASEPGGDRRQREPAWQTTPTSGRPLGKRTTAVAALTLIAGLVLLASWFGLGQTPQPGLRASVLSPARVGSLGLSVEVRTVSRDRADASTVISVSAEQPEANADVDLLPGDRLRLTIGADRPVQVYALLIHPDGQVGNLAPDNSRPSTVTPGEFVVLPPGDDWYQVPADDAGDGTWELVVVADSGRQGDLEDLLLRYRLADATRRESLSSTLIDEVRSRGAVAVTFTATR